MTGRQTAAVVAAWGIGLAVLAVLAPLVGERDLVALSQLPAAVLGTLALAGGIRLLRDPGVRRMPDASVGAAALGAGLTLAVAGFAEAPFLVYLAAPVILLGALALVVESRP